MTWAELIVFVSAGVKGHSYKSSAFQPALINFHMLTVLMGTLTRNMSQMDTQPPANTTGVGIGTGLPWFDNYTGPETCLLWLDRNMLIECTVSISACTVSPSFFLLSFSHKISERACGWRTERDVRCLVSIKLIAGIGSCPQMEVDYLVSCGVGVQGVCRQRKGSQTGSHAHYSSDPGLYSTCCLSLKTAARASHFDLKVSSRRMNQLINY